MRCFSCDAEIELGTAERVGFRDTCDACSADLHVCRNCRHHDPNAYNECRESSAERVAERERGNRCEYFSPGDAAGGAAAAAASKSRSDLEALFKK
ncbi:MAG: hypothetical protein HRU01_01345 [Myxococcales bacterium]|nr:hypothetical protein [Myxococcales bacterium]